MSFASLSPSNGFNPGSLLWVTEAPEKSFLARKLDWYLNFQIYQAKSRKKPNLSAELQEILKSCEIPEFDFDPEIRGLLVESSKIFPNRWVLFQDGSDHLTKWVKKIFISWNQLKQPSLRIFLPPSIAATEFQSEWLKLSPHGEVTLVHEN